MELDREALARARANFLLAGLTERNDEIVEMRKKIPEWTFAPMRWVGH